MDDELECHNTYQQLIDRHPSIRPRPNEWTCLAGVIMKNHDKSSVIALASGQKCLPSSNKSTDGSSLNDSHAEVLARRACIRYLIAEFHRGAFEWDDTRGFIIPPSVSFHLYISECPCGDASMRALEMSTATEEVDRPLKRVRVSTHEGIIRGRNEISTVNRLRTKPARIDAESTDSLSCSDKLARWASLGFQSRRMMQVLAAPVYFDSLIVGG
eukprot:Partr_v1_DN27121_c1_g1_i3_m15492 putative adenosine deaminase